MRIIKEILKFDSPSSISTMHMYNPPLETIYVLCAATGSHAETLGLVLFKIISTHPDL